MEKGNRSVRLFSLIASVLLIFSLSTPGAINAKTNNNSEQSLTDLETETSKISNRLVSEFEKSDKVTFLIKMNEKAKTKKAIQSIQNKLDNADMGAEEKESLQRSTVISELKTTAVETQQNIKDYLMQEVNNGNAKDMHSYYIVNALAVTATKDVAEKIAAFNEVEKILPNEKRKIISPINVENNGLTMDENVEWNVDRVNAPQAWDAGVDGKDTVVATIDTGVQWDHPALRGKYRGYNVDSDDVNHDYNWYDATDGKSDPYDDIGHGTHVTGTMVGGEPDGSKQIGVAPNAKWIAVKAFTDSGGTDADLLDAAEWIMAPTDADGNENPDLAPDIVNNSWGGGPGLDEWYRDVVISWRDANIFPVFAAGNVDADNPGGPESVASPANYPESFAVGATDIADQLARFSLKGPSPYEEIKPDISAPGQVINSSVPGGGYAEKSGTSMAAPAISGVAALMRSVDITLSVDKMDEILKETAKPLTDEEYLETPNNGYGYGLVDALTTVLAVNEGVGILEGTVINENGDPLEADVAIADQGRKVRTDPEDGSYSFSYAAGEYDIEANAYGYQSEEKTILFEKNETITEHFTLEPLLKETIHGQVTNEHTGEPVNGATLLLKEDTKVTPVKTDENGAYNLTAYEGEYTLQVKARDYRRKEMHVVIDGDTREIDIDLKLFHGYLEDEYAYDDGSGEGGSWFHEAGSGWGVRMSLPEGKDEARVTGGKFLFSKRGGDAFQVEVFDSSGTNGAPGEKIAGPIDATAVHNGEWTVVDLSDEGIIVEDDFYVVYKQTKDGEEAPKLQQDKSDPFTNRSWENYHGHWYQLESDFLTGNKMIRALVDYEIEDPVITSPGTGLLTGKENITVEGKAAPETTIQLLNNGKELGTKAVDNKGEFAISTELVEGENELTAKSIIDGEEIAESKSITVTLDTIAPELTIDNPSNGDKTNRETGTIEGTVLDDHLDSIEVNGESVDINGDGIYSKRTLLDEGENTIEVIAKDLAGNKETKTITIDAKFESPEIKNLTPTQDQDVEVGDSIKVEFESEPGLKGTFLVHMPLTNAGINLFNATELPVMEMSDGHYVGYWTIPSGVKGDGAAIEVKVSDSYGNEARAKADGKLRINLD